MISSLKLLLLLCLSLFSLAASAQKLDFQQLLDSGKAEYRRQVEEFGLDYHAAYSLLEEAVRKDPKNAEARYWFAHAIDKVNANLVCGNYQLNAAKTIYASEQLEKVITLEKLYTGERLALDPYSKLTAIWSSQALAFKNRNLMDSAMWAFREGKKRGGFNESMLDYSRQLLSSCDTNAILFTQADFTTQAIIYLQDVEGFRRDISMVDVSLASCDWYIDHLRWHSSVKINFDDPLLDSIGYTPWTAREEKLVNPDNKNEFIKWKFRPTWYEHYVVRSDLVILNIYKENFFKRPFYYSGTYVDSTMGTLHLDDANYIVARGIVSRVKTIPNVLDTTAVIVPDALRLYNVKRLVRSEIENSPDVMVAYTEMRYAFMVYVELLLSRDHWDRAAKLWKEMEERLPLDKLPLHPALTEFYSKIQVGVKERKKVE